MSPAVDPVATPARAGWLLRLGTRAALASAAPVLALAGTFAVSESARRTLAPALLLGDPALRLQRTLIVAGAGLLLLAALGRAVVLAVSIQWGAGRMQTGSAGPALSPPAAGVRGLVWVVAVALFDLTLALWYWTGLLASGAALLLGAPVVSLLGALGLALVLTVGLVLGIGLALWLEVALVVSVVQGGGLGPVAGEALGTLLARPGFLVGSWLVTAVPAGALAGGFQVMAGSAPGPGRAAAAAAGAALLLVALVRALATLIRFDAVAALVLDRQGRLPAPPVPRATLVGRGVLEARPVGPLAPWGPGEPR